MQLKIINVHILSSKIALTLKEAYIGCRCYESHIFMFLCSNVVICAVGARGLGSLDLVEAYKVITLT